jgi:Fe-S oxidoreductase/nitrate reductase gamma subunit
MVVPVREFLMPSYAYTTMYVVFLVSGIVMLYGLYSHLRSYGIGLLEFFGLIRRDFLKKLARFLKWGVGQRKVLATDSGGAMHGAVFFGFLMLLIYTTLIFIESDFLRPLLGFAFLQGNFYLTLEFLGDTLGIAFIVGLFIAIYRRFLRKLEKLETKWDDYLVISMLVWIGLSGFLVEAFRFIMVPSDGAIFSPVGDALSMAVSTVATFGSQAPTIYQGLWWAHMLSVMALIAITPYTKLIHVFTSGFNVALAPIKPMGRLNTPFNLAKMLESGEVGTPPSVHKSSDFAPLQLLALDACTNCGRCQEVCPAYISGRDLSPRVVVQDLGGDIGAGRGDVFASGVIRETELWACTMCNACVSVCPVFINQVDYIAEYRRTLVTENKIDGTKKIFLENVARNNNPFGLPQADRQGWLTQAGVPTVRQNPNAEYLYWIGCQSSYDSRGRGIPLAMIKILRAASVNFAILGNDEMCTGEPVRRMGEEGRFQELAMKNIETIRGAGAKKVVVHCAHCFNTFKNEYPEFGGDFEVIHHTQLISQLISEGKLKLGGFNKKVTFHDPCNLGRMNGVFDAPRAALGAAGGLELLEMKRSKMTSFCCGGGGANVWYQVPEKKKISVLRVEEARSTGAEMLAVACPFCITMFEDATKATGSEGFAVRDVAEIVADAILSG